MGPTARRLMSGLALLTGLSLLSCGGGGSGSSSGGGGSSAAPANVVSVVVDGGPASVASTTSSSINTLYTTVTVCVPGSTTQCQIIDHIEVDTQSDGLRILAPALSLTLAPTMASDGNSLVECTKFVNSYSWGPIALADIQIGGETAGSVPIQVIGASNFATVPADCSNAGVAQDTVVQFGANGILGIGVFEQDCGSFCAGNGQPGGNYYSCSPTACSPIAVSLTNQVQNPVPLFKTDNNGTIIVLPAVTGQGATTVTGSLIFGIDTESNNASGKQTILTVDPNTANITVLFNGQTLIDSFIDSGTNGIYFDDASIAPCPDPNSGFYCPASTLDLSAMLTGTNGTSISETFSVDNADSLFTNHPAFAALPTLAGSYSSVVSGTPTAGSSLTFDWGLPFYYGRRVATAIENHPPTSVATGPYMAF